MRNIWLALFLSGCVVTDVGNPQDSVEPEDATTVEFRAYDSTTRNALVLDTGIEITHAWVVIHEAQASSCDTDSEDEIEIEYEGPIAVDLISGRSFPGGLQLSGNMRFCELKIDLASDDVLPAGAPADLVGQALLVRAVRADDIPVVVRLDFEEELRLRGEVEYQPMDQFIVGFAANEWFDTTLADLEPEDGVIVLDSTTNVEAGAAFQDAFLRSSGLFEDEDRDGEFDDDEKEEIAEPDDE